MFSAPCDVVVPPLAVNERVALVFEAFDVNDTVPVAEPFEVGAKVIVKVVLLPGATVIGNCVDGTPNSRLSTEAAVIIKLPPEALPVFEICTVFVEVVPVCTVPKSNGFGKTVKAGAADE